MIPRNKVDIKILPIWIQYLISLSMIGIVMIIVAIVGKGDLNPFWITEYLVPILGWLYLIFFLYFASQILFTKKKN